MRHTVRLAIHFSIPMYLLFLCKSPIQLSVYKHALVVAVFKFFFTNEATKITVGYLECNYDAL